MSSEPLAPKFSTLDERQGQSQSEPTRLSVSALVTNYNSWTLARECVEANVSLHGGELSRIVLLDDASPTPPPYSSDGSFELICNAQNLGFARNLNQGIAAMESDIVVLWDADARPLKPYLDIVRAEFERDPSLGLLGFSTVGEGERPTPSWDKEPNAWSLVLGHQIYSRLQKRIERREKRVCLWMCALAVRTKAFEDLGGFDEGFDWLDVDIDLSVRANRSRWKLFSHPNLLAFHEGGGTPTFSSRRLLQFHAARWRLLLKHHKMKSPRLCRAAILARLHLEYALMLLVGRRKFSDTQMRREKIQGRRDIIAYCKANFKLN